MSENQFLILLLFKNKNVKVLFQIRLFCYLYGFKFFKKNFIINVWSTGFFFE